MSLSLNTHASLARTGKVDRLIKCGNVYQDFCDQLVLIGTRFLIPSRWEFELLEPPAPTKVAAEGTELTVIEQMGL